MPGQEGVDSKELRSTRVNEIGFVAAVSAFGVASVIGQLTGFNPQLYASILSCWLIVGMHAAALWRASARRTMAGIVLMDCILTSVNHPEVQSLLGHAFYLVIGNGTHRHPYRELWSFRTTFLYYLMVSYLANFVLRLREASVVVPAAAVVHCSLVLFSGYQQRDAPYVQGVEFVDHVKPDIFNNYLIECVLLIFGLAVALLTKRASERWEVRVIDLLAEQKSQVIHEKVLRCKAEFSLESARDAAARSAAPAARLGAASEASASVPGFSAPSMCSAPACLAGPVALHAERELTVAKDGESQGCAVGMDCLPSDGLVWVEGHTAPCALSLLSPGKRVLAYDLVSKTSKHVKVLDVQGDTQAVDWVQVELADGTAMKMTADHPVQVAGAGSLQNVVRAVNLRADGDHVMVHTVVTRPVMVSRVSRLSADGPAPQGRVYVTVQQPERHSILVTAADHCYHHLGKFRLMAVGSADLQPAQLRVGNTFLRGFDDMPRVALRRAHSWPLDCRCSEGETLPSPASEENSGHGGDSTVSQFSESAPEATSEEGAHIALPVELPSQKMEGRLSSYQMAQSRNLPSIGSANHGSATGNTCVPCSYAHKGTCRSGRLCNRCHGDHTKVRGRLKRK